MPCVIFAGGRSSRMGRDKSLLPFCGFSTLTEFQYRRLKPHFKAVYISAKREKFPFEAPVILDGPEHEVYAPSAGLIRVFESLEEDKVFILSVDTPFVGIEEIAKLAEAAAGSGFDAVIAKSPNGIHPMCGIYSRSILPAVRRAADEGNYRLTDILRISDTSYVEFPFDDPFFNINRPAEYESALKNFT
ncbi:molybdopterin-guanine dinucleotide biosynthesis protein MobA [Hydrogenimonas sp.]|nr:molybdopterin-guanine dinucleotide biosynthesis protein MobA [Hydrogenimonas sp.]